MTHFLAVKFSYKERDEPFGRKKRRIYLKPESDVHVIIDRTPLKRAKKDCVYNIHFELWRSVCFPARFRVSSGINRE